jgi:hypothetical protein
METIELEIEDPYMDMLEEINSPGVNVEEQISLRVEQIIHESYQKQHSGAEADV